MANNTYTINQLATGPSTVTVTDDGTGNDWLNITGVYTTPTDITLKWTVNSSGNATSASGMYFDATGGHRLVVNGVIENVRGSNGQDNIRGNQLANIIYGDQAATGSGQSDTIDADLGNDTVYGGSGNDTITGDDGNDLLQGDGGADSISGGAGRDTVIGGTGADVMSGGADSGDTVSYATSTASVKIDITHDATTTGSGGDANGDRISGFTNVIGSAFNDSISDTVKGTVAFGYNNNTFYGGDGNDRLVLGGGADKGYGGKGTDKIYGEDGNDSLFGEAGTYSLTGGLGKDVLTGGDSADRFIFTSVNDSPTSSSSRDQIKDFSGTGKQGDKIDLSVIDAIAGTSANDAFKFIGDDAFTKVKGQLHYKIVDQVTIIEGDVNGDGKADFAIEVAGRINFVSSDFIL